MMIHFISLLYFIAKISGEDLPPAVIGGNEATPHAYPWQVSLRISEGHGGGGSLIKEQWILTAAHCLFDNKGNRYVASDVKILLGAHYTIDTSKNNEEEYQEIPAQKIFIHEKYETYNQALFNDIALIKMTKPAAITDFVKIVTFPKQGDFLPEGRQVTVTGWGNIKEYIRTFDRVVYEYPGCSVTESQLQNDRKSIHVPCGVWMATDKGRVVLLPDALHKVDLRISNIEKCFENRRNPRNTIFCAGDEQGEKDACSGDSGGPLVIFRNPEWIQFGIVSTGPLCSEPIKWPAVYTSVSYYKGWIIDKISQNED